MYVGNCEDCGRKARYESNMLRLEEPGGGANVRATILRINQHCTLHT